MSFFFFQEEDGIRDVERSRGLGDVYKRQPWTTRVSDEGLYDADASNKKVQDMKRRIALIEESEPALTVSIHQNSPP